MDKNPEEITEEKLLIWSQKLSKKVVENIPVPEITVNIEGLDQEQAIEENLLEACIHIKRKCEKKRSLF